MTNNNNTRVYMNLHRIRGRILSRARQKKDIIFGGRSIQKQIGLQARRTKDIDIFTKKPKKSAKAIKKLSNKITRGKNFFIKRGKSLKTTRKVKWKGRDGIKNTEDDRGIVDYNLTPKPEPKTIKIDGIKYRTLDQELIKKLKIIKDPKFKFRREKDLEDVRRILKSGRV
jgi:hypothetical protein